MKSFYAYIRVSTVKQGEKGSSLSEQRDAITHYARRHNLAIGEWFEEMETAAKRGRRVFTRMLSALARDKASGVILHKIDRGARNLWDWASLQDLIDRGLEVHFAHESLDLNSRGGRLSADIQAVVAADYSRHCPVTSVREEKIEEGVRQSLAPVQFDSEELSALGEMSTAFQEGWQETRKNQIEALKLSIGRSTERIARLTDAYIDRMIEPDLFEERKRSLLSERKHMEEKLRELIERSQSVPEDLARFLEQVQSLQLSYEMAIPEEKREILKEVTSNLSVSGKNVAVSLRTPYREVANRRQLSCGAPHRDRHRTALQPLFDFLVGHFQRSMVQNETSIPRRRLSEA